MNHKKLVIMGIWIGCVIAVGVMGRELPLQQVSHPECKGVHWQELSDECKIFLDVPMEQSMKELLVSVLWGASYTDNHIPGSGSHPSFDLVSAIGTAVYAIGDGKVMTAKYRPGYGNAVTIQHTYQGETIYSNYSHLSVMNVRPGQNVEQGMKVGEVGRSGFTMGPYGYHLDFQITTADSPSHPYGFHDCKEGGYVDVVNNGLCKDKLERYTIDPGEFFALNIGIDIRPVGGTLTKKETTVSEGNDVLIAVVPDLNQNDDEIGNEDQISSIVVDEKDTSVVNNDEELPQSSPADTVVIRTVRQNVLGDQQLLQEHAVAYKDPKNQGTLITQPGFDISWEVLGSDVRVGAIVPVQFTITQDGEPVSGKLAQRIQIVGDAEVELLPGSFTRIYKGKKTIFVRPSGLGEYRLAVRSGEVQLGEIVFVTQ